MEKRTRGLVFKSVVNMAEEANNDFFCKTLHSNKMGDFAIIEIKDCGVVQSTISLAGEIRPNVAVIKELLRDYAPQIARSIGGFEYPMVTVKITDGFGEPIHKRNVLCKREYWVEFK